MCCQTCSYKPLQSAYRKTASVVDLMRIVYKPFVVQTTSHKAVNPHLILQLYIRFYPILRLHSHQASPLQVPDHTQIWWCVCWRGYRVRQTFGWLHHAKRCLLGGLGRRVPDCWTGSQIQICQAATARAVGVCCRTQSPSSAGRQTLYLKLYELHIRHSWCVVAIPDENK